MPFSNKVVVITGAGSGIGEKTALKFAKLNARLALIDKNEETLNKSANECEKVRKTRVYRATVDLIMDNEVKEAIDKIVKEFGRIDVLINCAGIYCETNLADKNYIVKFDKVYNINLRSIALITHFTAKHLIKTKGNIVNMASTTAVMPSLSHAYPTHKAALVQFTKVVATELAQYEVRVNCVLAGFCKTNLLVNAGFPKEVNDEVLKIVSKGAPLKTNITEEDISEIMAFLASDKAKSITGAGYVIDLGMLLVGSKVFTKFGTN